MDRAALACFHCGLPVLRPGSHRATVLGVAREFCCPGCASVSRVIVAGGFEAYYQTREPPQPAGGVPIVPPRDLPPATAYDDPAAQRQFVRSLGAFEREATLILDRLACAACVWLTEASLRRLPGVTRATVDATTHRAQVAWDTRAASLSGVIGAIRALGYDAFPWDPAREDRLARAEHRRALWRLFVAGFGAMQVMMYAIPGYLDEGLSMSAADEGWMRGASLILTVPVILISCRPFFESAVREWRAGRIGLDTPIALGIAAGFAASVAATLAGRGETYFDSISMLVFLLLAARWAESAARRRAGRALDRVLRWAPAVALRMRDPSDPAGVERIAAHALSPGEHVLVPAGERVPADGVVVSGVSGVDESLLTGEARPVAKAPGAPLVGGAVVLEQALVMRVARAGSETRAAAIARLVERASATRPEVLSGADRVARALTVVVLAVAVLAALGWSAVAPERALWVAIAVLVVTCPCALALAAPIVLTGASARLLGGGVLLARARAVQALAQATDVVFDKTGTLTEGRLAIAGQANHAEPTAAACLAIAQALEASSRHPVARAFLAEPAAPVPAAAVTRLVRHAGLGIEATVGGVRMRLGSEAFCAPLAGSPAPVPAGPAPQRASAQDVAQSRARLPAALPAAAVSSVVHLAREGAWLATWTLADRVRDDAAALVRTLAGAGLRVHLVSGDHPAPVIALADALAIEARAGGCSPEAKLVYVERLQRDGCRVLMVGDGLNDTPVLARADVSVAVAGGADAAQLQADLVLLGGRLGALSEARAIALGAMRLVRQNLGWAVAWNAIALPLAAAGLVGPWEAAVGMAASSAIVAANALRVFQPRPECPPAGCAASRRARGEGDGPPARAAGPLAVRP